MMEENELGHWPEGANDYLESVAEIVQQTRVAVLLVKGTHDQIPEDEAGTNSPKAGKRFTKDSGSSTAKAYLSHGNHPGRMARF